MIKTSNLFLAIFLISSSAFAGMNADYRCEQNGGGIAIKLPAEGSKAKIWQTDVGDADGLELKVKSFVPGKDAGNYSFTALQMGVVKVRGTVLDYKLTYELYDSDKKMWTPTPLKDVLCVKQTAPGAAH